MARDPYGIGKRVNKYNRQGIDITQDTLPEESELPPQGWEPVGNRPAVPPTTEQPPPGVGDTLIGRFAGFMDRIVPDDLGGLIRGENEQGQAYGWLGEYIPTYRYTAGKAYGAVLDVGGTTMDVLNWGTEQANHLGAFALAAAPGGVDSITWDQAYDISFGQVMAANQAKIAGQLDSGDAGQYLSAIASSPFAGFAPAQPLLMPLLDNFVSSTIGQYNVFTIFGSEESKIAAEEAIRRGFTGAAESIAAEEDFDITDPEQRYKAFITDTWGASVSGVSDGAWAVLADPFFWGGKGITFLRLGAKLGSFTGLTNRSVNNARKVAKLSKEADENLLYVQTKGKQGRWTALGEHISYAIGNAPDIASKGKLAEESTDSSVFVKLASQIHPDDFEGAVALFKAGIGDPSGWRALRETNASVYDQLANYHGIDPLKHLDNTTGLTDDQVRYGQQLLDDVDAATKEQSSRLWDMVEDDDIRKVAQEIADRDGANVDAVFESLKSQLTYNKITTPELDALVTRSVAFGGQLITRAGGTSVRMARWANVYRSRAAAGVFGKASKDRVFRGGAERYFPVYSNATKTVNDEFQSARYVAQRDLEDFDKFVPGWNQMGDSAIEALAVAREAEMQKLYPNLTRESEGWGEAYVRTFYPAIQPDTEITLYRGLTQALKGESPFELKDPSVRDAYWSMSPYIARTYSENAGTSPIGTVQEGEALSSTGRIAVIRIKFSDLVQAASRWQDFPLGQQHVTGQLYPVVLRYDAIPEYVKSSYKIVDPEDVMDSLRMDQPLSQKQSNLITFLKAYGMSEDRKILDEAEKTYNQIYKTYAGNESPEAQKALADAKENLERTRQEVAEGINFNQNFDPIPVSRWKKTPGLPAKSIDQLPEVQKIVDDLGITIDELFSVFKLTSDRNSIVLDLDAFRNASDEVVEAIARLENTLDATFLRPIDKADLRLQPLDIRPIDPKFGVVDEGLQVIEESGVITGSDFVSKVVSFAAGSRPIRILRYVGRGLPTGVVHLKGGDGAQSLNEIRAFLQRSTLSQERRIKYFNDFAEAQTPTQRLNVVKAMEQEEVNGLAAKHGIDADTAIEIYQSYNNQRAAYLNSFRSSQRGDEPGFAVDQLTGEMVKSPFLYTQLDESFPILDQVEMNRVITANKNAILNFANQRTQSAIKLGDTINTAWKIQVLMRLGYTQRNITEGMMRSLATIGLVALNPEAWLYAAPNAYYYMRAKGVARTARTDMNQLKQAEKSLYHARKLIEEESKASRIAELEQITIRIENLKQAPDAGWAKNTEEVAKLEKRAVKLRKEIDSIDGKKVAGARIREQEILDEIDAIRGRLVEAYKTARALDKKRRKLGRGGQRMPGGETYAAAFDGAEGEIARILSSADSTMNMTFTASFEKRKAVLDEFSDYSVLDPAKIDPTSATQIDNYYDNLTIRLNQTWRNDPLFKMWAQNDNLTPEELIRMARNWLMSDEGKSYRKNLSTGDRDLGVDLADPKAIDEYVEMVYQYYDAELPKATGVRELLLENSLAPSEVRALYANVDLPKIPGLATKRIGDTGVGSFTRKAVSKIMHVLASAPENILLRHPFYNTIYRRRQLELYKLAREQGLDVSSKRIENSINASARREALKETRRTMYTIERQTNASNLLRWVSPFFPAFTNSLKTWGRIIYDNPAVVPVGDKLWNIPNELGIVVDENGNKYEGRSSFLRDEGTRIVYPEIVGKAFAAIPFAGVAGGFLEMGETLSSYQSNYNVVFQGANWWDPTTGPAVQIPAALILRNKPEVVEVLRSAIGDKNLRSFLPATTQGAGGDSVLDVIRNTLLSTAGRRFMNLWEGPEGDGAYKALMNTMIEDAIITAKLEGRDTSTNAMKAAIAEAERRAGAASRWFIWNALTGFTTASFQSKYAKERATWNAILDDPNLATYEDKINAFLEKYPSNGEAFLAITRSGSESEFDDSVYPSVKTWQKLTQNKELVNDLYSLDPDLIPMFANMGNFDDPFSPAVYTAFRSLKIGDKPLSTMKEGIDIVRENRIADGWREYFKMREEIEADAIASGFNTLNESQYHEELLAAGVGILGAENQEWIARKQQYSDRIPTTIRGFRMIIDSRESIKGEDQTLATLAEWLEIRDGIAAMKAQVTDPTQDRALNKIAYEEAYRLRSRDIGFADLYDMYLADDNFRVVE